MPPKGASTKVTPMRLPPLHKLRVRRPNSSDPNPCLAIMTSVLTCWASAGYNIAGCASVETQLRACMDEKRRTATNGTPIGTETHEPEEEHDQLPPVENVPQYCWSTEAEVSDGEEESMWPMAIQPAQREGSARNL
ncbi:hypothetical protein BP6252_10616 [Coleophoma cylindrospora]|uniref:37S ribosomal protein mrp10, mitochondrial n=1 Tax=Coleophoma cylindrospora TaxID=1849047 RepID=A0A3D8QT50_9HELO|nr:hypothetical protein BP6252_10616 [Coleophoma cylindrospora]